MKRLTLVIAAVALVVGAAPLQAGEQCRAAKKATLTVNRAACDGSTGYCGCGPGWISACAPRCCRCVPCW